MKSSVSFVSRIARLFHSTNPKYSLYIASARELTSLTEIVSRFNGGEIIDVSEDLARLLLYRVINQLFCSSSLVLRCLCIVEEERQFGMLI